MRKLKLFSMLLLLLIGVGQVWATTTTLFQETWGSYTGAVSSYTFTGTTASGGTTGLSYSVDHNSDVVESNTAGSITTNNLFFYKKAASSLTISGIDLQGAKNLTLSFKTNGTNFAVYYKIGTGAEQQVCSNCLTGANSKTITLTASGTMTLRFNKTGTNNNNRLDDIVLTTEDNISGGGSGNPTVCATPTFSVTAGTYTSTQSVALSCETDDAKIYYTTDGTDPTESETKQAYTTAISVSSTQTIKAYAEKEGLDNSSVATAEYIIYPVVHAGTSEDPYTVADARNMIDANKPTNVAGKYVTGKVSKVVDSNLASNQGWITYDISVDGETSSDQFRVYKGKSYSGNKFTSADDIQVGDVVVVSGTMTYYTTDKLYEFTTGGQLISLSRVVIVSLYNGANGATKVGDFESGTDALPTMAADVAGWTFDGNWSKDLFASKTNSQAYASGTYFAGGAEEYSGTNLYAIYRRTPTGGSAIYSTQPTPGYPLSLDPATGDLRISANKDLAFIPVGESVTLSAVGGLVTTWTVYDSDLNDITSSFTYTSSSSTSFVFDMPAKEILVEATMCALPAVPSGLSSSLHDGGTRGKTVFSWTAGSGATKYTLTYTKAGSDPVVVSDIANTTYTVNPLAVGEYTWSVKSVNDCGESAAVNGEGFTICPDFAAITPTVGAASSVLQTTATANWTAVAGAAKYTVQVYKGDDKVKDFENETGTSKAITGLTSNTTYVVKVTAYNTCNEASITGVSAAFTTLKQVYTVTLNTNGGTINAGNITSYTETEGATLPTDVTKTGYNFDGWFDNSDLEGDAVNSIATTATGNLTFWAGWSAKSYDLSFNKNADDAEGTMNAVSRVFDAAVALPANTFTRDGYQFMGWATTSDGSKAYDDKASYTMTTEGATLYAVWAPKYTVNWIVNGTTKTTQTAIAGTALTTPYSPVVSDCDNSKAFVGWTETQHYSNETDAPGDLFDYANTLTMPVGGANYYAVFADEEPGTEKVDKELNITISNFTEITTNYSATYTHTYSVDAASGTQDIDVEAYGVYKSGNGIQMNFGKSTYIKNIDALPGYIKKIDMTWTTTGRNSPTLYAASNAVASTSSKSLGEQSNTVTEQSITIQNAATNNYKYFYFDGTTVTGACYMSLLKITYVVEVDATVRTNYTTDCSTSLPTCEAPEFDVTEGEYTVVKNVTITCATDGATIYYTTDGSNPATSGTKDTYGSTPVRVDHTLTLKAVAVKTDYNNSSVTSADYTITLPQCATPTISLVSGYYSGVQSVTLTCETANASIYYTTDGNDPTTGSTLYTGAINVDADMTLKAVAIAENTTLSAIASADYIIVTAGSTVWELVSDVNDLKDGDIIVIASNAEGKTMSSEISSNVCSPIATTFSANKLIIESLGAGSGQFTLSKSGDNWKLHNESGYLSSTTNKQMSYVAQAANATAWTISISSNDATINAGGSVGKIMHNTGANPARFTTYTGDASATMLLPQIYRKSVVCEDPDDELAFASSIPAAINNTQTAQLATTGGNGEDVVYTVISANAANATISNDNKFSATAAGTYTVQAKQEMSADYKCAQVVTKDITVTVLVSSVDLNKNALTLEVGQFETLEATVLPADAANKNVTWSVTEGSAYVEVDANGKVTGKAVGNGVVQVATEEGGYTATCAVTVKAPTPVLTLDVDAKSFGNVEIDAADPAEVTVVLSGVNLVENVTYEITGEGKDLFAVTTTLNNATISGVGGQEITVIFDPEALGAASATLTFKSGVAEASVDLSGTGVKRFTVTLEAGNGSVASASPREATVGGGIVLPEATLSAGLTADGWSFAGWATEAIATEASAAPATMYTKDDTYYPAGEGETLYAIYTRTEVVDNTASSGSGFGCSTTERTLETGKPIKYVASANNTYFDPLRLYKNNSLTFSGATITKIEFTKASGYTNVTLNANVGTIDGNIWTGSANSVSVTPPDEQIRLDKVIVTYSNSTGHYTTYPTEIMHITFNLNGGEGNFPVQNVNKGADFELDGSEPTKQYFTFDGWSDGVNTYAADGTISNVQGNMTLTAQWNEVGKADVIFKNGETTVQTIADKHEGESYDLIDAPAAAEGEQFTGWRSSADNKLYEAGKTGMTMSTPADEVIYTAEWLTVAPTPTAQVIIDADMSNGEWILVTNENQIHTGDVVIIAAANSAKAMSTQHIDGTKYWRTQVDVTKEGNKINEPSESVVKLFVQNGFEAGQFSLYDMNTANKGYLTDVAGGNYLGTSESIQKDGSWIITVSAEGVATIQSAGTEKYLKHNSSSTRFACYSSGMQDVALYKWVKKITTNTNVSDVTLTDAVIVPEGQTLTIDEASELDNLTVEAGGQVSGGSTLTVNNLTIKTSLGTISGDDNDGGKSGEISNSNITANGDVWIEIELTQASEASFGWYAFSVPFPVNTMNGVYYQNTPLQNEVGYAIMAYHEDERAAGKYAWKKYRETNLVPGMLYIITVGDTDYKTLRFKKAQGTDLIASTSVPVSFTAATGEGASGWNGVGNPNLQVSHLNGFTVLQFLDHDDNCFRARTAATTDLLVGTAFMVQVAEATENITIATGANTGTGNIALAPARAPKAVENSIFEVKLRNTATGKTEDNLFFTAREDATNEYEIGRDVAKMSMGNAKCAQMWIPAYGTQLCAADFQLVNNQAEYPLTINTPKAGTYSISAQENENATIYLTQNGSIIWNLSMSACELDLAQGLNEGYGLKLVINAPAVVTGVDLIDAKADVQKVIIDEHVFILRGGQIYGIDGKIVK